MASGGQKALSGAATGAAAGASVGGPWGALIGGVAGGIGGLLQGSDPTAPNYQPGAPPAIPGGTSGQYGGVYYDPTTGSTQNLSYNFDPTTMGNQIQNQSLYNQLMGQGNSGMTNNLDFQAQSIQQQLARLQAQNSGTAGVGSQKSLADVLGPGSEAWIGPDGKSIDPADREALMKNGKLQEAFQAGTGGHYGSGGSAQDAYFRWVQDAYKQVAPKIQQWQQSQDVNVGNSDQRNQAIQSLQNQLDYINKAKTQSASGQDANNPMMNFLNQRNQIPGGTDYAAQAAGKYVDPMQAQIAAAAQAQLAKSGVDTNTTLGKTPAELGVPDAKAVTAQELANFDANKANLGGERIANAAPYAPNPLAPDTKSVTAQELANFNALKGGLGGTMMDKVGAYDPSKVQAANDRLANLTAQYSGGLGGERMADPGAYNPANVGDFINSLNRQAQRSNVSNQALAQENAARRGVLGGSSAEVSRLANEQALQDQLANNASQGYSLGQADKNNWLAQKFAIDSHNSDVTRLGAQANLAAQSGLGQQQFNNEQAAQQQWFNQNFGVNQFNSGVTQQGAQNQISGLNNILQSGVTNDLNAANLDQQGRQQAFANQFGIDTHNSNVAQQGAQGNISGLNSILQGGFGNETTSANLLAQLQQQAFMNNAATQQTAFGNAMGAAGTANQMGQNTLNNQRYDINQGNTLDQQNYVDRMNLAAMLQGQTQQGVTNQMNQIGVTNQQAQIGNQMGQFNANNTNQYNAANAAGQNAQAVGQWQSGINDSAATQTAMGQGAMGIGAGLADYYGGQQYESPQSSYNLPANMSAQPSSGIPSPGGLPTQGTANTPSTYAYPAPLPAYTPEPWVTATPPKVGG